MSHAEILFSSILVYGSSKGHAKVSLNPLLIHARGAAIREGQGAVELKGIGVSGSGGVLSTDGDAAITLGGVRVFGRGHFVWDGQELITLEPLQVSGEGELGRIGYGSVTLSGFQVGKPSRYGDGSLRFDGVRVEGDGELVHLNQGAVYLKLNVAGSGNVEENKTLMDIEIDFLPAGFIEISLSVPEEEQSGNRVKDRIVLE